MVLVFSGDDRGREHMVVLVVLSVLLVIKLLLKFMHAKIFRLFCIHSCIVFRANPRFTHQLELQDGEAD